MAAEAPGRTVAVLGSYAPSLVLFRGPLIAEMVRRGHRVVAMAPRIGPDIADRLAVLGAEAREVPMINNSLSPVSMARTLVELTRLFREIRPHTVIAYTVKPVTLGALAGSRAKVPSFVALITGLGFAFTEGGGTRRRLSRAAATFLYRRALKRARAIIFQNPDDRDHFERGGILPGSVPVSVVDGSGIDLDAFSSRPLPREPRFLMISRLLGDKGVREYGAAAALLKRRYPSAVFRLVGYFDGSPDSLAEDELDRMITGGVDFLGRMDDVRAAIESASICVLPSYREGTPRSVLEAMAMGRPIVTTDAPGCRQTVEEGSNGFLVPPRDAEALAAAMERFIVDPSLIAAMGERSRELAERRFDVHSVNAAILQAAGL
ncbi:glycosyltransferase family 4 protein [Allosphingosinicella sp.]|jgi:glycosyltransferase involved in cell wall biosynthesis|uniref:glycosyltransferase family 4 protein n=1 Tax=Allosphingosinicella sp. TaxID=2823234 RepID=UPI002EFC32BC